MRATPYVPVTRDGYAKYRKELDIDDVAPAGLWLHNIYIYAADGVSDRHEGFTMYDSHGSMWATALIVHAAFLGSEVRGSVYVAGVRLACSSAHALLVAGVYHSCFT